jgi:hypothetical protein
MATDERAISTPIGGVVGGITENLQVLGIASYLTQTLNQPNAKRFYEETATIEVPVGTVAIVAAPDTWFAGFGRLSPEPLDPIGDNPISWTQADHHLGVSMVYVFVTDVNAPDLTQTPPRQTAELRIGMLLSDDNSDDRWFGIVGYTLTFLGAESVTIPRERKSSIINTRVRKAKLQNLKFR